MKKFWAWFLAILLVAIVAFVIVVCVMAHKSGVTVPQEIQSWFENGAGMIQPLYSTLQLRG